MKTFTELNENSTYREYYDAFNEAMENLNDEDILYKSNLGDGVVFSENIGYVNNQPAYRNTNIIIPTESVGNFKISGFKVYSRHLNKIIDIDINCDLHEYNDGKPHFLYLILTGLHGLYEVEDDMFSNGQVKMLFARFILSEEGNMIQFYNISPFAGSPDYIKGNKFYTVSHGLNLTLHNENTKRWTLAEGKISFPGINFDSEYTPDVLNLDVSENAVPIRYIYKDDVRDYYSVDWSSPASNYNLLIDKKINYNTAVISNIPANKFSIQKIYYDLYTNNLVAMYGNNVYDTMETALVNIGDVLSYPVIDERNYLLPIAAVIVQNQTESNFNDDNLKIINMQYESYELFDSNQLAIQQSYQAIEKANQALAETDALETVVANHKGDKSNPHEVKLSHLGLDDNYADYTPATIIEAAQADNNTFYKKTGGTISGNVNITGTLSTSSNVEFSGTLKATGAATLQSSLSVSGATTLGSTLNTSGAITEQGTSLVNKYAAKSHSHSYLPLSGGTVSGATTFNNTLNVNNGYIIIGGISLRLGSTGGIPTGTGYALK